MKILLSVLKASSPNSFKIILHTSIDKAQINYDPKFSKWAALPIKNQVHQVLTLLLLPPLNFVLPLDS